MPSKHNNLTNRSQASITNNSIPWAYIDPMPDNKNIIAIILAFKPSTTRILNQLLKLCRKYKLVYAKQETIAQYSGIGLTVFKEELNKLIELGLISKKNMGANKSCWYKASRIFNNPDVRAALKNKLSIFYICMITLLQSVNTAGRLRCNNVLNTIYLKQEQQPKKEELPPRRNLGSFVTNITKTQRPLTEIEKDIQTCQMILKIMLQRGSNNFVVDKQNQLLKELLGELECYVN